LRLDAGKPQSESIQPVCQA
jgi:hypothetical protein